MLIVVLCAEGVVRAGAAHLAQPLDYYSPDAQLVVNDMNILAAHGITSDITFVGTSMVRRDIDANQVEKERPEIRWAHNVALPGAQTTVVERWLLDVVIPKLHPKRIVWGMSSLDFNANHAEHPIASYNAARATEPGFYGSLDRVLGKSAISEHRDTLRDPLATLQGLRSSVGKAKHCFRIEACATWPLRYPDTSAEGLRRIRVAHEASIRNVQLHNFVVGNAEFAAFQRILAALKQRGIPLVIMVMPTTDSYISFHPHGARDFEAWRRRVVTEAARQGVPLLDLRNAVPNHAVCDDPKRDDCIFRDYEHMWAPAAHRFTHVVIERLKALGW